MSAPARSGKEPVEPASAGGESSAAATTTTCAPEKPAEKPAADCRPRVDRRSLRSGSSTPASIRRVQRAGHAVERHDEPGDAREFAGRTLRILLEILDRRRPVAQLTTLCAPALIHTVGSLVAGDHVPSRTLGAAVLTKYRLFPAGDHVFELVAMYERGPRCLVLAGRVEHTKTGWKVTALRLA
ncbi:Rv3235 family protein [Nocardia sp. NPDC051750]|uniref:Rv3235 family protein n=1 Tax=Nocardia sp. NPDC051750 TaxID=3364325 RepID=UPI0037B791E1